MAGRGKRTLMNDTGLPPIREMLVGSAIATPLVLLLVFMLGMMVG